MMLGAALLVIYFIACALTSLPILSGRYFRRFGLGLNFVFMPIAVLLASMTRFDLPFELRLYGFAQELSWGLIYAMLWFRMADMWNFDRPVSATPA